MSNNAVAAASGRRHITRKFFGRMKLMIAVLSHTLIETLFFPTQLYLQDRR